MVELQLRSNNTSELCKLNAEFICEFISKLPRIEKFIVVSKISIVTVYKIIDLAPNINELDISQIEMEFLSSEINMIVKSIRMRRAQQIADGQRNPKKFNIVVNMGQWRELQHYRDVDTGLAARVENGV